MNQKSFNIFVAAYIAILIPLPGRFVFGLVLLIELLLLTISGTLISSLISKLNLNEIKTFLIMLTLISCSIFYRQLLVLLYPEIVLTLGFYIYIPAISLLLLHFLFYNSTEPLQTRLIKNLSNILIFCCSGLGFCLLRDLAGYGTFTFFGKNHQIYEKVISNSKIVWASSFIASIPGALIFAGILLFVQLLVKNKMRIIKNAEVNSVVR